MTASIAPTRGGMSSQGNIIPKGFELGRLQTFTPEQQKLFSGLFSQTGPESYLGRLSRGDSELFGQMEAPALSQFAQLQGGLASRFSRGGGAGSLGTRHSSGFQNTQNQAASDFAQQLQSNRMELQRQALNDLLGLSQNLLGQRPYDQAFFETPKKQPSFLQLLALAGVQGLGQGLGSKGAGSFLGGA